LSQRVDLTGKDGFFKQLSEGLNDILDNTDVFISDMSKLFEEMAEGNLGQSLATTYQGDFENIANNANATLSKLSSVLNEIMGISNSVNESANEISQGSVDLSNRTESQASSLEETAASMEEITSTVKESEKNSDDATSEANDARTRAESGGQVVNQAVEAMKEISDSSNKINDIIGVIDEIAFQTNLLALNAAVEAARAGEHGRGFAVVAGEVRTLSQRSASAAKEIKDLIRDSVNKVESGSMLVNQTGETLSGIVHSVEQVARRIESVNVAAKEQSNGIGQINQAISQMDEMTQQNAALVEETAAASRSMSDQANKMQQLVRFFRT
jgi:methyl-accepting chemotaxis protein